MSAESYADLLEGLFAAYEDRHSLAVIESVAAHSRIELASQTAPDTPLELLERLVRQRLEDLTRSRKTPGDVPGVQMPRERRGR